MDSENIHYPNSMKIY